MLLGIDGPPVCLWGNELVMGRRTQPSRLGGEDRPVRAIGQQGCRSCIYRMGSMACFRADVTMTLAFTLATRLGFRKREIAG